MLKKISCCILSFMMSVMGLITAFAVDENKIFQEIKDRSTTEDSVIWSVTSGFLKIGGTVVAVLAILIILVTIIFIAKDTFRTVTGKSAGIACKDAVKKYSAGLIIGILLFTGGWVSILQTGKKVLVDSSVKMITSDANDSSSITPTPKK